MNNKIIDIDFFELTNNGKVFSISGRGKGEKIRKHWKFDTYDKDPFIMVNIKIPEEMYNLSPSFIQGLFSGSIKVMDRNDFYDKYKFYKENESLPIKQIKVIVDSLYRNIYNG